MQYTVEITHYTYTIGLYIDCLIIDLHTFINTT